MSGLPLPNLDAMTSDDGTRLQRVKQKKIVNAKDIPELYRGGYFADQIMHIFWTTFACIAALYNDKNNRVGRRTTANQQSSIKVATCREGTFLNLRHSAVYNTLCSLGLRENISDATDCSLYKNEDNIVIRHSTEDGDTELFTFLFREDVRKSLEGVFNLTMFAGYISAKSNEEKSYHHDEIVIFPDKIDKVFDEHTDGKKKTSPCTTPPTKYRSLY